MRDGSVEGGCLATEVQKRAVFGRRWVDMAPLNKDGVELVAFCGQHLACSCNASKPARMPRHRNVPELRERILFSTSACTPFIGNGHSKRPNALEASYPSIQVLVLKHPERGSHVRSLECLGGIYCGKSQSIKSPWRALGSLSTHRPRHTVNSRRECLEAGGLVIELTLCQSIDFVVPDDALMSGAKALANLGRLTPCPDPTGCITTSQIRNSPPPAFHKHVDASEVTVGLYQQSETLWFLPPLDNALLSPTKSKLPPQYILASGHSVLPPWRPGRGSGVFERNLYPVVVPRSHVLLEALLRIYARDAAKRIGGVGIALIGYIEMYVDDDGLLDVNQLPEPLRGFYKELHGEDMTKPLHQWTKELREALGITSDASEDDFC